MQKRLNQLDRYLTLEKHIVVWIQQILQNFDQNLVLGVEAVKSVIKKMWIALFLLCVCQCSADQFRLRAEALMKATPLIDGHNDFPYQLLLRYHNQLGKVDLNNVNETHTNINKLKAGLVGAQFWVAYAPCSAQYKDAVRLTLEQIDVIQRMDSLYSQTFRSARTSNSITTAFQGKQVASLIGVEGGHSIDSSMATLRLFYKMGVRYMTITHSCNTPWADNWRVDAGEDKAQSNGLSQFGKKVILEMNRLGMIIDLAHTSVKTMNDVLDISKAPVMFSHSSAYTLCNHNRNVPDAILKKVRQKNGIVMVNFFNGFVTCKVNATLSDVADHFDYIKKVAGYQSVGFGGDYDGVPRVPTGLEDVSFYPDLVAELLRRKWTDIEVKAALGENFLRVFQGVEKVRNFNPGDDEPIPYEQVKNSCRTSFGYEDQADTNNGNPLVFMPAVVTSVYLAHHLLV
ncbi:dipeptidase 1 isoform X1 [Leucoraja erinacea]|uniref:dipeptidase 1 isoform X1 n=2 Tax=Leucoraja erinaceus TaxID=7782 RepID=UPI00245611E0|nr:dipeptidase 1 isoform X1 [Leucoraja erinacea]